MTNSEYQTLLENCNFRDGAQVSELVTSTHTNVQFEKVVNMRELRNPMGAANYFGGLFGTAVWEDGIGTDKIREYYADPFIPFTFSHFVRSMQVCDVNSLDECNRDRCKVPEGGRGTMPGVRMFKFGFETPRDCIANIRTIRDFQWWAARVLRGRELMDEQIMNMFYTLAGIQTAGHKVTMQGYKEDGLLKLLPSTNPRNAMRVGLYNYMEERFPQPTDFNTICPLTVDSLEGLARYWAQFPKGNEIAKNTRGESVYEFWYPDDWYQAEAVRNPDYMEKLKLTMPAKLFSGYSLVEGQREIIGNFAPRVMPWLPRLAPTSTGEIVPVDTHVGVDIEVGKEYVGSIEFENAPFGLAGIVSGRQGNILTRPTLTQSGAGFPINPISSDTGWRVRNEYDKDCNKDMNMPYSQRDYEMGFEMTDQDASMMFLFRRRKFNMRPVNECDLAPVFQVASNVIDCAITRIGCDNKERASESFTEGDEVTRVNCTSNACGANNSSPYGYLLKIDRKANQVGYDSLGCACGHAVELFVYNENNVFVKQISGTIKSAIDSFPYARYIVETTTELTSGQCIKGISCADSTRRQGNVIDAFDTVEGESGDVSMFTDSPINCDAIGDDVQVRYYDINGTVLGVVNGVIAAYDPLRNFYRITSSNPAFQAEDAYTGQHHIGLSCNEAPFASSSSSGA